MFIPELFIHSFVNFSLFSIWKSFDILISDQMWIFIVSQSVIIEIKTFDWSHEHQKVEWDDPYWLLYHTHPKSLKTLLSLCFSRVSWLTSKLRLKLTKGRNLWRLGLQMDSSLTCGTRHVPLELQNEEANILGFKSISFFNSSFLVRLDLTIICNN